MEAVGDFLPLADADQARSRSVDSAVDEALALLRSAGSTAVSDAAPWGFGAASDFAGQVEELSRAAEYLQLLAAGAVDRPRKQDIATAGTGSGTTGWTTGWRDTPAAGSSPSSGSDGGDSDDGPDAGSAAAGSLVAQSRGASGVADSTMGTPDDSIRAADTTNLPGGMGSAVDGSAASDRGAARDGAATGDSDAARDGNATVGRDTANAVDDGYRNTTKFLRARLRISAPEARRRLALAGDLLPRTRFGGQELLPPVREELGAAVASAEVSSRTAGIITAALDRVRHVSATRKPQPGWSTS
ncbi:hypothetical protein QFZ65_002648 [Arthrobacter sp. B3I9]|uniref:DUF222 domain-containing protein n=1 Tax=Arthrobacter sp. B3I9 TaxID=3042270 RepID=UPI0027941AF5|nr:DUF222 domain-containing protein [Arthrobacter sp. B3I9]MDQ0850710.1 hypothetical protein [Arthrobacter sp. B3I9]